MLQVKIFRRMDDGRWAWSGDGHIDGGQIADCPADLGDEVYEALEDAIDGPGSYRVEIEGEEYRADVEDDAEPADYIVIDDGQFQFPVLRTSLRENDSEAALRAMDGEQYGDWCLEVPMDRSHGDVGSQGCIDFCGALKDAGVEVWHLTGAR